MAGLSVMKDTMKEKSGLNAATAKMNDAIGQVHAGMNDTVSKLQSTQGIDSIAGLGNQIPGASGLLSGASSFFGKK